MNETAHISVEQFDNIAAALRVRGWPGRSATREWAQLDTTDQNFWRQETARVLAAGRVKLK